MKKTFYFLCFLFVFQTVNAQKQDINAFSYTQKVDEKLRLLDKTVLTTAILYDRVFPLAGLAKFNEVAPDTSGAFHFYEAYSEIQRADYNSRWQTLEQFVLDVKAETNVIPIGILNVDFERLDERAVADNLLRVQGLVVLPPYDQRNLFIPTPVPTLDGLLEDVDNRPRSPYLKENVVVISPLRNAESLTVHFTTGSNFSMQAANVTVTNLQVDFGNGQGYQNMPLAGNKTVTFSNPGLHNLKFKIGLSNNTTQYTYAKIKVSDGPSILAMKRPTASIDFTPQSQTVVTEFVANIGFQGYDESRAYYGSGAFAVYKGGSAFDKPVIVLDGFDPNETYKVDYIYNEFLNAPSGNYLGDRLRSQDFDIIPLNFLKRKASTGHIINGGTDYIERNAMVLVRLIQGLNDAEGWDMKEPIKVIGFSMGGLVARYALRYMELHNMPHHVDLFISVDAPHKGAVVPMGAQYVADFLADMHDFDYFFFHYQNSEFTVPAKLLNSPAAKQMLKHHYLSGSETPAGAPGFYERFYNKLENMGFPQEPRNIAVANGVATGKALHIPGQKFIWLTDDVDVLNMEITLHFSPRRDANAEVANIYGYLDFWLFKDVIFDRSHTVHTSNSMGSLENAPGGFYGIEDLLGELPAKNILNYHIKESTFTFIPTKSALAFSGGLDLYEDFSSRNLVCAEETPFDSYFTAQSKNQEHISLNYGSAGYIYPNNRNGNFKDIISI